MHHQSILCNYITLANMRVVIMVTWETDSSVSRILFLQLIFRLAWFLYPCISSGKKRNEILVWILWLINNLRGIVKNQKIKGELNEIFSVQLSIEVLLCWSDHSLLYSHPPWGSGFATRLLPCVDVSQCVWWCDPPNVRNIYVWQSNRPCVSHTRSASRMRIMIKDKKKLFFFFWIITRIHNEGHTISVGN